MAGVSGIKPPNLPTRTVGGENRASVGVEHERRLARGTDPARWAAGRRFWG